MTMGIDHYILVNSEPKTVEDVIIWARWFETHERRLRATSFGEVCVSTIFLGLDHQFGQGKPLLFETMVFANGNERLKEMDQEMFHYHTAEEAVKGHEIMCHRVSEFLPDSTPFHWQFPTGQRLESKI